MPSHRAEGPGLIHRSCRAIILGRFPEPKTPGVRHARSAGMRAADTGRSVTPRDRAAARPPTPTAVRSVAGTTSVNASASGRPLRFRLIGRTGVSACATDVACSAKPGAGSARNRRTRPLAATAEIFGHAQTVSVQSVCLRGPGLPPPRHRAIRWLAAAPSGYRAHGTSPGSAGRRGARWQSRLGSSPAWRGVPWAAAIPCRPAGAPPKLASAGPAVASPADGSPKISCDEGLIPLRCGPDGVIDAAGGGGGHACGVVRRGCETAVPGRGPGGGGSVAGGKSRGQRAGLVFAGRAGARIRPGR